MLNKSVIAGITICLLSQTGHKQRDSCPHVIDGLELDGYRIAIDYMESPPHGVIPFKITNYRVAFEGNWNYYFLPKRGPEDKDRLDHDTTVGPSVRVRVDKKSRKVLSAVIE